MLRYTLRSLALLIPALLLAHFFGYAYAHLVAPLHAARNPLYATAFTREPLLASYASYLGAGLGPLPGSQAGEGLGAVLASAALNSLGLLAIAMVLSVALGVGLGLLAVRDNPPRIAPWLTAAATLGLATPTFYFGVLGVTFVIMWLIWMPGQTLLLPLEGYGWGRHLVLPVVALMLRPTAQIAQMTAGMMVTELGRQYVVTARSIGVAERRIARRHVLRNALPAVVSTIAGSLRLTAGELVVVETLFYWPGLGRLMALALIPGNSSVAGESALFLSPPVLGAALALFAALFLLVNLASGLAIRALDPRLR
ncbi:MAG TPA: ABC transporter permease [Chloroflexaceae bacterium]|nr:ABC transporter permease [Chloroflexaceae bacterium]